MKYTFSFFPGGIVNSACLLVFKMNTVSLVPRKQLSFNAVPDCAVSLDSDCNLSAGLVSFHTSAEE